MNDPLTARDAERSPDAGACRVLVVGLGGGGCNAVAHMYGNWREGPECVVLDSDEQTLASCEGPRALQLGKNLTRGAGTGSDAVVGRLAGEDDLELLRDLLRGVNLVFLVVALGGGTGTGAAPVVARVAKEVGALVLCLATLPFAFEGEARQEQARKGLRELRDPADAIVVQANDRLLELTGPDEAVVEAFAAADAMLAVGVRAIWRTLTRPGIINVTFSDLSRLVEHAAGTCTFGYGSGHGADRVQEAVKELLASPLLERGAQVTKAAALLVCITAGTDLRLQDVQRAMDEIRALAPSGAHLFLGVTLDEDWKERMAVTVLAAEEWNAPDARPVAAAREPEEKEDAASPTRPRRREAGGVQVQLELGAADKGRFKDVEPTLYEGQDLDVPTYIRRGVKLTGARAT